MRRFILLVALVISVSAWADSTFKKVSMYTRPNGGYVMVDEEGDIIGFSDSGNVQRLPEYMDDIFQDMGMEVQSTQQMVPLHIEAMLAAELVDSVGPLLDGIAYDQGSPYNDKTPKVRGQHCLAGCVAIAMAQIMAYYQHPKKCTGSVSYKTGTLNISIAENLEGYSPDWTNILPTYKNIEYSDIQSDAISQLVYYCGVSVQMNYGLDGSGASSDKVVNALTRNFDFSTQLHKESKSDYIESKWHQMMQDEIKARRPMYMSSQQSEGAGHAYVCDGFKVFKGQEDWPYYHMNWGWNGSCNGWFRLNKLVPGGDNPENFTNLTSNQSVIFHIIPNGLSPVDNIAVDYQDNDAIYDILGRRVSEMKSGNIYIKGGKKVLFL